MFRGDQQPPQPAVTAGFDMDGFVVTGRRSPLRQKLMEHTNHADGIVTGCGEALPLDCDR